MVNIWKTSSQWMDMDGNTLVTSVASITDEEIIAFICDSLTRSVNCNSDLEREIRDEENVLKISHM